MKLSELKLCGKLDNQDHLNKMNKLFIIPIICLTLISCGKKKEEDIKPYIETITNGEVSCYRVVSVKTGMFGVYYLRDDTWKCSDGTIAIIR